MKNDTILVTATCGDIGSAAVRSLSNAGLRMIGCDIKPYSPVLDKVEKHYQSPPAAAGEQYLQCIADIIARENINFFFPISEPEIAFINLRRAEVESLGVMLVMNNRFVVDTFLDKLKTARYLGNLGIKVPRSMMLTEYEDNSFGFPLIVKPQSGCGSKRIMKIEDNFDLEYAKKKNDGSLIVQEYIGSEEEDYTTAIFSDGNTTSSITFQRKLGYGGVSIEAVLADEPFLDDIARVISAEVKLRGSINLQSRKQGNIFLPYEINPRLSSTLLFRNTFGFDDAVWWVQILKGKSYSYKKRYKAGRALRGLTEFYFDMEQAETL